MDDWYKITAEDIHKKGGGIGFTVQHTRESSIDELKQSLSKRLDRMMRCGTTTVEAKSGYGLNTETEMKMLQVLHETNKTHPLEIISTYLGAHSIPKGSNAEDATKDIIENQIPQLIKLKEEGKISPSNIDVFFEKGVYELNNTRKILKEGKEKANLKLNFHGDELNHVGSGELGEELGATAISHLEKIDDNGMDAMARKNIVAVLLPTTAYILRLEYPKARKLIEKGVAVALGTDFNPNAHCLSMPFVMHLACVNMHMKMNEALVAATLNSAASLGISSTHGSIEVGKIADFVIVDSIKWEHVIYELIDPPISSVWKRGKIIYQNTLLN